MRLSTYICIALIVAGLTLQWAFGPIAWSCFARPVNIIVMFAFAAVILLMHLLRSRVHLFRYLSTLPAALPAIVAALVLTLVMGLTRQEAEANASSSIFDFSQMLRFWPFVLAYTYLTLIVGLTTLRRIAKIGKGHSTSSSKVQADLAFIFNHAGLFIALTCATLGNPDVQRLKMITSVGSVEWRGVDDGGLLHDLPIAIELRRFLMESYDDGSPRRFSSDIRVRTKRGEDFEATVDVNHPVKAAGWKIYQYSYDTQAGADSRVSIFELVRDPWLPFVYAGIIMMLAGALFMLFSGGRKEDRSL